MTEDRVARIQQQMLELVTEELQGWLNDLMKDAFDPRKVMAFIRSMGIDISQLPGIMTQQPGFDPYRVLDLDKSASDEEVKKRYREMSTKLHPDKAGHEMTFLDTILNLAYQAICKERGIS